MDARTAIINLIHQFAEYFDAGDFDAAMQMFDQGQFRLSEGALLSAADMRGVWDMTVRLYDGSPRTRHIITNHILTVSTEGQTAECRSCYTVNQAISTGDIITVAMGRYIDQFAKDGQGWHFTERDYRKLDYVGDLSHHMTEAAIQQFIR